MSIEKDKLCECGDMESQHIDNEEQCCVPECGCKEFVESFEEEDGVELVED